MATSEEGLPNRPNREPNESDNKEVSGGEKPTGESQGEPQSQTLAESESDNKQIDALSKEISNMEIKEKPRFVCKMRGLPWSVREKEIKEFFKDEKILEIQIVFLRDGKASGEALVEFETLQDFQSAYSKNQNHLGHRYVEIFESTGKDIDVAARRVSKPSFVEPKTEHIIRMRGLPYEATENDVVKFFSGLQVAKIHLIKDNLGRPSGEGFVEFATEGDVVTALTKHRHNIGRRYIEVFRSGRDDLMKMSGFIHSEKTFGRKTFHSQKSHARKEGYEHSTDVDSNCLLMRGLPYSCSETDITKFFQEIDITPVRIHRKADGTEAYVEFSSIPDCSKAMTRHKNFIGPRYIELFRVTYEDMARTVGLSLPQQRLLSAANDTNFQPMARNVDPIPSNFGLMPNTSQRRTQQTLLSTQNTRPQQLDSQLPQYPVRTDTSNANSLNQPGRRVPPAVFR